MNIVNKVAAKIGLSSSRDDVASASYPSDVPFDAAPCAACPDPCHASIPSSLLSKIDKTEPLVGSVKPYRRHVLVIAGEPRRWAEKIEEPRGGGAAGAGGEDDGAAFICAVARAAKAASSDDVGRILVTAARLAPPESSPSAASTATTTETAAAEIMSFPEMVSFPAVTLPSITTVVESLVAGHPCEAVESRQLGKGMEKFILVCAHLKRDKRCGVIGPVLVEEFVTVLRARGVESVKVYAVSHVGGHKFAGNVIIYPEGQWYGRVLPHHVPDIVDRHIIGGKVIKELWRGRMDPVQTPSKDW